MDVAKTIESVRSSVAGARREGGTVALVPTMGSLHAGHASLMTAAVRRCDYTVVSIFVNPTQFGPQEDMDDYPQPFESDCALCHELGVDLVFAPTAQQMYGQASSTWVQVVGLTDVLCGRSRPDHFRGVTTVCTKLFNIVAPDVAFFGQKDAQQALVVKRMVQDLNMPLAIEVCPTIREPDGLAVSSRNQYLDPEQRREAARLYQTLQTCQIQIAQGRRSAAVLIASMRDELQQIPRAKIDYVSIVDSETLIPVEEVRGRLLIALAVQIGPARLIDNILVDLGPS
ncbi:MAG: pantoate--beta-alanine ligase [Planctomycetes bacterium]|nr:pantoate--beta-alanine ligase [Planctomycetota bacterium]